MTTDMVQTSSERLDKDRVKVRVEVAEGALAPAVDAAYRRWARDIKVPGFRRGKVPRQLIDARVGADVVREEAVREALPELYRDALHAEALEAIAPPDIEIVDFDQGASLVFEATVDVRPDITVPDLASITIEAPSEDVTDDDVDEQLERLRDRFAELETIGREARRGDFALVDLKGYRHDEPIDDASAPDFLYEVGSRSGPSKLDEELEGTRPGAILKFNDVVPLSEGGEEEISFTVLVKEVKAKKLPPLDDDFAKTAGEFDTLTDLRADLRERLRDVKREMAREELRARVLERVVDASDLDPPDRLVDTEFEHQMEHLRSDLESAGMTLEEYGRQVSATELEIRRDIRSRAYRSVRAELLLEEVARTQEIGVTEEEIGREIAIAAARTNEEPQEVAKRLVESGRLSAVAADIMRRKALDHVVDRVDVVGRPDARQTRQEESD
jgi:trigger factor